MSTSTSTIAITSSSITRQYQLLAEDPPLVWAMVSLLYHSLLGQASP